MHKPKNPETTAVSDTVVSNQLETFKSYFNGPKATLVDGELIYRAKSSKDAKIKASKALTYITSLGLQLKAFCGPDNTIVVKAFNFSFKAY